MSDQNSDVNNIPEAIESTSEDGPKNLNQHGDTNGSTQETKETETVDDVFEIIVKLPHEPDKIPLMLSTQEQVQDLRQSIMDTPTTFQYTCFHLELNGERINDFIELSEVKGLAAGAVLRLIEDPYTEKEARMHLVRIRELIGVAGDRVDNLLGISAGVSLHDRVVPWNNPDASNVLKEKSGNTPKSTGAKTSLAEYEFDGPASIAALEPPVPEPTPKTIKGLSVSAWNPPPHNLRQRGHLLYLQLTTHEGEQYQITSHVSGFYVNKSSNSKFDPFPKPYPKDAAAHSLMSLINKLSASFRSSFESLMECNSKRDPLANFQLTNAIPSNPWLVFPTATSLTAHQPDITRVQETYLLAGVENTETLRDWNEEIQSTRELPREALHDRVFRERLMSKILCEFNEAAARGAVMVARGEIAPLNPTESKEAQIFVYNNIFYSFGADGVGTFTSEGGDEAARTAVGKDVCGVRSVNQLDIAGVHTAGTIIIDYLGRRLVAQSIVPGIFKQREPEEHQVDYGGVEGRDVVADNEVFVSTFSKVSKALRVKKHPVWDKEGKKHVLEGSVETKGLLGTDGRKYILDLYRLTPLDISWLEAYWTDCIDGQTKPEDRDYPHRMTTLRPELIESYWRLKMSEYVKTEVEKRRNTSQQQPTTPFNADSTDGEYNKDPSAKLDSVPANGVAKSEADNSEERVDISTFNIYFNPDVYCGQIPQTDEEKEEWLNDEREVRAVCDFLHSKVLLELVQDLREGEVGFPMDGTSLSRLMHKRGINMRYLGKVASLVGEDDLRLQALKTLATQEMIARSFKHIANTHLKNVPSIFAATCMSHLLNCLLGAGLNAKPPVEIDEDLRSLYSEGSYTFVKTTPQTLMIEIEKNVRIRYRYTLGEEWSSDLKHLQLLRDISLKIGLQMLAKNYRFNAEQEEANESALTNGTTAKSTANIHTNGNLTNGMNGKKKKKTADHGSPALSNGSGLPGPALTFVPDDICNVVPVIKDSCPKSVLAEEALEAGRISMMQGNKEMGQELLVQSLTLHEQVYGILHPEVARVYHQLAMLYHQIDEKAAAVELAHKAVIISERTLGVDSDETVLSYLNLGLFEHGNGNTSLALSCVRHALELWKIIYGTDHPDSITTMNNAAVMLQQLKLFHESRIWFEASISVSEKVAGKSSVSTATLMFQLAQALALDGDSKAAVAAMREAYTVFLAHLGPEHRNTKESENWLEQLTQSAVSIARQAKDLQSGRIRRVLMKPRVTLGTRPQPQVGQSSSEMANSASNSSRGFDSRSIDELIRFIEGGGDTSKSSPRKKRSARSNPKRRGGGKVAGAV